MQAGYATTEAYGFHHQPPPPHYYGSRYPQPYPSSYSYPPASYPVPPSPMQDFRPPYQSQNYQPPANNLVGYTDDAATKLTDRVRRKCYNCRTTDTSTWRRSNLTPGKVVRIPSSPARTQPSLIRYSLALQQMRSFRTYSSPSPPRAVPT
jgi:hypothetical protein